MARVSVAMAAYNGEAYLQEQLDSILNQLNGKDEVILSDDGSTDGTLAIVQAYMDKDPRIHLIRGPGRGIKQNIANAIAHTSGDFIFLADQDDVWMPGKVRRVLEVFREKHCHLVVHDCIVTGADLSEIIYPSYFDYRGYGAGMLRNLWKNKYIGCCMAFHKSLVPYILPIPDDIQMHDQWIGFLNDKHHGGGVFLKEPLLYYRRHDGCVSDFGVNTVPVMIKNRLLFLYRQWSR